MKILFLDENRSVGQLLQSRLDPSRCLAPDGSAFEIEIETDYAAAREKLKDGHRYDAAIIDTSTAAAVGGAAREIVSELKEKPTLALVLTALPSLEDCIQLMRAGAWDYVPKLGSIDQIAQRLVETFRRAALERPAADPDALYVEENFAKLADEHADQWIAVGAGRFLGSAGTYDELVRKVDAMPVNEPKFWRMPPLREAT